MNSKVVTGLRIVLGLLLVASGVSFFFVAPPADLPAPIKEFMTAMMNTGYFLYFVKFTEIAVGLALLANRFVPLALVILAPVSLNIIAFHLFLQPAGIVPGLIVAVINLTLGIAHIEKFKPMLQAKN